MPDNTQLLQMLSRWFDHIGYRMKYAATLHAQHEDTLP